MPPDMVRAGAAVTGGAVGGRAVAVPGAKVVSKRVAPHGMVLRLADSRAAAAIPYGRFQATERSSGSRAGVVERYCKRLYVSVNGAAATADPTVEHPKPIVRIDNVTDPFATKVSVQFGDRLGELLDTVTALKNLGLNIKKGKVARSTDGVIKNTFFITDAETSEKVLKSTRLEEIRLTILQNMLQYHPEVGDSLVIGQKSPASDNVIPLGLKRRVMVPTTIDVREAENGSCSVLDITTTDRPGLLVDVVSVLKDINVNVVSAEIDTEGTVVKDELFVTYHGEPLNSPMIQLVTNALQYYLSMAEVEREESY